MIFSERLVPTYFTPHRAHTGVRFFIPNENFEKFLIPKVIKSIYPENSEQKNTLHIFQSYIFMTRTPKAYRKDNLLDKRNRRFSIKTLHSQYYPTFKDIRGLESVHNNIDRLLKLTYVETSYRSVSFGELLEQAIYNNPPKENTLGSFSYIIFKNMFIKIIMEGNCFYYEKDKELTEKIKNVHLNKYYSDQQKQEKVKEIGGELERFHLKHYEILYRKLNNFLNFRKKLAEGFSFVIKKAEEIIDKTSRKEIDLDKNAVYLVDPDSIPLEEIDDFYNDVSESLSDNNFKETIGRNYIKNISDKVDDYRNGDIKSRLTGVFWIKFNLSDPELPFDTLYREIETTAISLYDQAFRTILPILIQEEKLSSFEIDLFKFLHFGHPLFNNRIVMYERLLKDYTFLNEIFSQLLPEFIKKGGVNVLEKRDLSDEDYDSYKFLRILMAYLKLYPTWDLIVTDREKLRNELKKIHETIKFYDPLIDPEYAKSEGNESGSVDESGSIGSVLPDFEQNDPDEVTLGSMISESDETKGEELEPSMPDFTITIENKDKRAKAKIKIDPAFKDLIEQEDYYDYIKMEKVCGVNKAVALYLTSYKKMNLQQAGKVLGVSYETVRKRVDKARELLKNKLKEDPDYLI